MSFPNEKRDRISWEDGSANELLTKELSTSGASGMDYGAVRKVKVEFYGIVGVVRMVEGNGARSCKEWRAQTR